MIYLFSLVVYLTPPVELPARPPPCARVPGWAEWTELNFRQLNILSTQR